MGKLLPLQNFKWNHATSNIRIMQKGANINRIKAVLAEQNRTSKWLAGELGKDQPLYQSGVPIHTNQV